jgi:OOP family OmpA-OmpF porin
MKSLHRVIFLGLSVALVAGCASSGGSGHWTDSRWACAALGAVAGGAAGGAGDSDYIATGAIIGAGVGALICGGKDTDGDGVKDKRDKCPGTPPGAPVDENGCEFDDDNDGVVNSEDQCPNTPAGAKVDSRGCELDDDGDGVPNSKDQCPGTPAGAKVNEVGCELDDDGDGVVNSRDRCPNTAPGTPVDNQGCDLSPAHVVNGVNFEFDSARLTEESKGILDEAYKILERHPKLKVEVAGHTDSSGAAEYNMGLSDRRAKSVMDYLVNKGANAANLTAKGYGETQPLADNGTAEGRAQNRRVEFRHETAD